ncbi:MAG: diguanylate cyclase [Desulfobulbaceae bacterium]|nr:MAG: diguanylate cyclase [Desulfobulbaceae bacterium]
MSTDNYSVLFICAPHEQRTEPEFLANRGFRVQILQEQDGWTLSENVGVHHAIVITATALDQQSDGDTLVFPPEVPVLILDRLVNLPHSSSGLVTALEVSASPEQFLKTLGFMIQLKSLYQDLVNSRIASQNLQKQLAANLKSFEQHSGLLDELASRDGLTGLYNRRYLNSFLPREFERCRENTHELALILFDLDYFHELNRSAGSSYGDFVLNDFGARLTTAVQQKGTCFRFSGEIFIVVMAETSIDQAMKMAEKLRHAIRKKPFSRGDESRVISISAGVASLQKHRPADPEEFIIMAETALFTAKSEGRNRVSEYRSVADSDLETPQQNLRALKKTLSRILEKTRVSTINSLQLLAKDIGGETNRDHIDNVRQYVDILGRSMNLPGPIIQTFKNAITLHTSIRFLLHNEMINKEDAFNSDDRLMMDDFPYKLAEITQMFEYFSHERSILLYHGERYDGTGYPEGLKGDQIPLGARIFALVDALAAMNADRPYRKRLSPEEIIEELMNGAGAQFDPALVITVLKVIKNETQFALPAEQVDKAIAHVKANIEDGTYDK